MPSTLTYPGVYIEEIPSGVRTITGVATSITAFVVRIFAPTDAEQQAAFSAVQAQAQTAADAVIAAIDAALAAAVASINPVSKNAAVYFPRLRQPNPLRDNKMEEFVPCGAVAGVIARTDATRGVWKAPAGLDATLVGVPDLSVQLTDAENGQLNPLGINCLRAMPAVGRSATRR